MLLLIRVLVLVACPLILYAVSLKNVAPEEKSTVPDELAENKPENEQVQQIPDLESDFNIEDLMNLSREEDTDDF